MTKKEIRSQGKTLRDSITPMEREKLSQDIATRLYQSVYYQKCSKVFIYVSFRTEVDTQNIISRALLDQKKVYVPRVEGKKIEFYEIQSLKELIPSDYGILEPMPSEKNRYHSCEPYDNGVGMDYVNLMLLPGLAFDLRGNRIGYGAGYYDRFLTLYSPSRFYKVALAFDLSIFKEIPAEEFDIKVDAILTPRREYTIE